MYEAASGRMQRLEKSALIIWNKHSVFLIDFHYFASLLLII